MPAAVNATAASEIASRRPFEVAPTFISRICASTYALAPPLAASVLARGPHFPADFVLWAIALRGNSAEHTAQQARLVGRFREAFGPCAHAGFAALARPNIVIRALRCGPPLQSLHQPYTSTMQSRLLSRTPRPVSQSRKESGPHGPSIAGDSLRSHPLPGCLPSSATFGLHNAFRDITMDRRFDVRPGVD